MSYFWYCSDMKRETSWLDWRLTRLTVSPDSLTSAGQPVLPWSCSLGLTHAEGALCTDLHSWAQAWVSSCVICVLQFPLHRRSGTSEPFLKPCTLLRLPRRNLSFQHGASFLYNNSHPEWVSFRYQSCAPPGLPVNVSVFKWLMLNAFIVILITIVFKTSFDCDKKSVFSFCA